MCVLRMIGRTLSGHSYSYIEIGKKLPNIPTHFIMHCGYYNALAAYDYGKEIAKDGNHVILLDMPGHFNDVSEPISDLNVLTFIVWEIMIDLMRNGVCSRKPVIHGWSLNGLVALNICIRDPDLPSAIVLLCSNNDWTHTRLPMVTVPKPFPRFLEQWKLGLIAYLSIHSGKSTITPINRTKDLYNRRKTLLASPEACTADSLIAKKSIPEDELFNIKVPVVSLNGMRGKVINNEQRNAMYNIPDFRSIDVEGFGHMCVIEVPHRVWWFVKSSLEK